MPDIEDSYKRLSEETGRPCYSVTFWKTQNGFWGARAGIGTTEFGAALPIAIEAAVENAIAAQRARINS